MGANADGGLAGDVAMGMRKDTGGRLGQREQFLLFLHFQLRLLKLFGTFLTIHWEGKKSKDGLIWRKVPG